jgi:putative membrane-bound dehydrogenase-like protein
MNALRLLRPVGIIFAAIAGIVCFAASALGAEQHPVATLKTCEMHSGLDISLFAKEPDIVDPVALCFDEDGRVFVVEMRDYPYGFGAERNPGGSIRLLEDTDGDGRADRSVLFAERLSFPTSIAPWNGGVIVTAPPEVIFLKDTDGDGKTDVREVLLNGFTLGVTDSNVNGLRWGLDNRLHGVNGGNGGSIVSTRKPSGPVPLRNFDFSFDPASGDFTPTFHTSAGFGLVFDEWGRSFVTYNINHIQQRMIPLRYLNRFPGFPPVEAVANISDHGDMSRIYPVSEPETRVNHPEQSGHFSSAGGMGYVGAAGYPGDLPGSIFVCDVVGNLVHRDVLELNGPIFTARRSPTETNREFFASRDLAFRPVGLELGPDAALYLIDMQRDVIEHPDYIPNKVKEKLDLRAGENRGRIYRLTPKGGLPRSKPNLRRAKTADLVQHLGHRNQWWRATAQRLIVERRDRSIVPALKKVSRDPNPVARLHALWTLRGLGALDEALVIEAIGHTHPGLRENGLLLAETLLPGSYTLRRHILERAEDSSARVRFQAAGTLGFIESAATTNDSLALEKIFLTDLPHRWSRLAVLSSLGSNEREFAQKVLRSPQFPKRPLDAQRDAVREMADLGGARLRVTRGLLSWLALLREAPVDPSVHLAGLEGLQSGAARSGATFAADAAVAEELSRPAAPALFAAAWKLSRGLGFPESEAQANARRQAQERLADPALPLEQRLEDVRLLALGDYAPVSRTLDALLDGAQLAAVQQAALDVLREFNETAIASNLVARWRSLAPGVRTPVLNLLLSRVPFHDVLVSAIEDGRIKLGELNLDLEQRRRLLRESSPAIMARAAKFIGDEEYSNRKAVVEEWLGKLPATGEAARGRPVFDRLCAQCHALDGVGHQVGPDLAATAHRSVEDLLSNILDPNMAIHPAYVSYTVETISGDIETGILESESADAVVMLQALGKKTALPRRLIKRLESSGLSLMPDGLEAGLSAADMRDLIAFLQQMR